MISFHIFVLKHFLNRFIILNQDGSENYFLKNKIFEYIPEPAQIQRSVPCCVIKHQPGNLEMADSSGLVRDVIDDEGVTQTEILRSRYLEETVYTIDFWLHSLAREVTQDTITDLIYTHFANVKNIKNEEGTITEFQIASVGIVGDIVDNTYRKLVFRCRFLDIIYHKDRCAQLSRSIENYNIGVRQ